MLINECIYNICRTSCQSSGNKVESYITTGGHSASLSWNKAPIWGLRPNFYYCMTVVGLLLWPALSDEKTGLTLIIAAGPRQSSHFRLRVQWDSWPYFTVSDSRLPISSHYNNLCMNHAQETFSQKQKLKLTAGNQPARSHLASGPAGTHGHIFVQCQTFVFFFLSLILLIDKGGVGLIYIYIYS
jgi:hypothetical protein